MNNAYYTLLVIDTAQYINYIALAIAPCLGLLPFCPITLLLPHALGAASRVPTKHPSASICLHMHRSRIRIHTKKGQ